MDQADLRENSHIWQRTW